MSEDEERKFVRRARSRSPSTTLTRSRPLSSHDPERLTVSQKARRVHSARTRELLANVPPALRGNASAPTSTAVSRTVSPRPLSSISSNLNNPFDSDEIEFFNALAEGRLHSASKKASPHTRKSSNSRSASKDVDETCEPEHPMTLREIVGVTSDSDLLHVLDEKDTDTVQSNESDNHSDLFCIPQYSSLPHYLQPTTCSTLPPYLNSEVDTVKGAFRTGCYRSLKKLPTTLSNGNVALSNRQHTVDNRVIPAERAFKPANRLKDYSFLPFQYVGTDYDKQKNLDKYVNDQERVITESYSRKPFKFGCRRKLKYEDTVGDPNYSHPDNGPGRDIVKLQSMTRPDATLSAKYKYGTFTVPKHKHAVRVTGMSGENVRMWLHEIHKQLAIDWSDLAFSVKFTLSNELLVQFAKPTAGSSSSSSSSADGTMATNTVDGELPMLWPPPNNLLGKYMQRMATHGLAGKFGLIRRGDRWNVLEEEFSAEDLDSMGLEDQPTVAIDANPTVTTPPRLQSQQKSLYLNTVDELEDVPVSQSSPSGQSPTQQSSNRRATTRRSMSSDNVLRRSIGMSLTMPTAFSSPSHSHTAELAVQKFELTTLQRTASRDVLVDSPRGNNDTPLSRHRSKSTISRTPSAVSFADAQFSARSEHFDLLGEPTGIESMSEKIAAVAQSVQSMSLQQQQLVKSQYSQQSIPVSNQSASLGTQSAKSVNKIVQLTFAFYAPWSAAGQFNVNKTYADMGRLQARQHARQKIQSKTPFSLVKFDPKNPAKFLAFLKEGRNESTVSSTTHQSNDALLEDGANSIASKMRELQVPHQSAKVTPLISTAANNAMLSKRKLVLGDM